MKLILAGLALAVALLPAFVSAQPVTQLDLGTAPGSGASAGDEYGIQFNCPKTVESDAAPQPSTVCPAYILDTEDIMAQPAMVVDPKDVTMMAFNALHGGAGIRDPTKAPAPTTHSRDNAIHQPHTTFQSTTGGSHWDDNRYYTRITGKSEVFGEDNAMSIDSQGRMTIASLYSFRNKTQQSSTLPQLPTTTAAGPPVQYATILWTAGRINIHVDYDKAYVVVSPTRWDATVDSLFLADVPSVHETVVAWREVGADGKGWATLHHRAQDESSAEWGLTQGPRIGPCAHITNPVEVDHQVYIGCVADEGYPAPGVKGQLQIHRIDPVTWNQTRVGAAPLLGVSNALLASADSTEKGGLVVAGAGIRNGAPVALVAFGIHGDTWSRARDYAGQLNDLVDHTSSQLTEARITALAYRGTSATANFVYMERYQVPGSTVGDSREFFKTYGVAQANGRFLGKYPLGVGDPASRSNFNPRVQGVSTSVFDDQHDSLVLHTAKDGKERLFLAIGDYGYVRFAEVLEQQPPLPVFPPIGAPAAIPTLASATSPVLVGAVAGSLATATALSITLARAKKAAEAPTL